MVRADSGELGATTSPNKVDVYKKKSHLRQRTKVKLFDRTHTSDELAKLRAVAENIFHACNCDSDGELNRREFVACVKALGYALDLESCEVLFHSLCAAGAASSDAADCSPVVYPVHTSSPSSGVEGTGEGGAETAAGGGGGGGLSLEAFTKYVFSKPLRSVVSADDCLLVRKVFDSFDVDGGVETRSPGPEGGGVGGKLLCLHAPNIICLPSPPPPSSPGPSLKLNVSP